MANNPQLLKGLLDLAVLSALEDGSLYGLSLLDRLRSEAGLQVAEGSIYPLLHRLERSGFICSEWQLDEDGVRPRKYYKLTESGHLELNDTAETWLKLCARVKTFIERNNKDGK